MVANISYQISDALLYLNKYGILHRDLKPDNILVNILKKESDKEVSEIIEIKLMDFGLSKIIGNSETTNEGYGTIAFIAPEILQRYPYNYKVDIWSLGVIMFYLVSGELPFVPNLKKVDEIILNICKKDPYFSKKFNNINSDLINLIKRCLEKKPEKRITIEEVINDIWFQSLKSD